MVIARTELVNSLNSGQQEAWNQAKRNGLIPAKQKKKVIVGRDELLCEICAPLAYESAHVPIGKPFQTSVGAKMNPGFHPQCRCSMGLVRPKSGPLARPEDLLNAE